MDSTNIFFYIIFVGLFGGMILYTILSTKKEADEKVEKLITTTEALNNEVRTAIEAGWKVYIDDVVIDNAIAKEIQTENLAVLELASEKREVKLTTADNHQELSRRLGLKE